MNQKPTYEELEKRVLELEKVGFELKQTEKALRQNEGKYRQLFELESDALFLIDNASSRILEANRAASEMYGYTREELLELRNVDLSAEPDYTRQATQDELPVVPVRYHKKKNGSVFPVEITGSHFKWQDRKVHIAAIREIGNRLQTEEDLRESEKRYRTLFERNLNPIAIIDTNGRYVDANPAFLAFVEKTKESLLRMNAFDFASPEKRKSQEKVLRPLWEFGGTIEREYMINGIPKVLELTISPIFYRGANAVVGVGKDITESKQSEVNRKKIAEELLSRNQFIETILDNLPIGLAVYYLDEGEATYINKKFEEIYGWPKDALKNVEAFFQSVFPDTLYREQLRKQFIEDIQSGDPDRMVWKWIEVARKDGGKGIVTARNIPLYEQNLMISTVVDNTESKKLRDRLLQTQKMESIGNLAGGIAHDFNNILFPIIGLSEVLLEDLPSGSSEHQYASQILKAGERGRDLVKQILAFSRQTEQKMMPVRIRRVIKEVLQLGRSTIPSNIDITKNIQSDREMVMANPTQIHQVAMNLLTNAYHAVEPTGGKIFIELNTTELNSDELADSSLGPGKYAVISISDTGCGIEPAMIDKIFEPYFTTKDKDKGTGLGLAVVYGIVKEHQGEIKAYSQVGKGSTFQVYLPLMEMSSENISTEDVVDDSSGVERILLVDDDDSVVRLERLMLERLGYRVTSRTSSVEALEAFRANPGNFDLVITDMSMPNMTGDELAEKLIAIRPDVPVVICTGFSEKINREKAEAMGIQGFLMKPVVKSEMAQTVRQVLDESKSPS